MIKLEISKMAKAIERAKTVRPRVRVINADERTFAVTGSKGDVYVVRFVVANGHKLAECDCKAGQTGMTCFHVAAAAALNIGIRSMRQQAAAVPVLPAKDADKVSTVRKTRADWYGRRSGNAMIVDGWAV